MCNSKCVTHHTWATHTHTHTHTEASLIGMNPVVMAPLGDRLVCCCQMFCSFQWQQWCCTWRSPGPAPARCSGPCVWCCCWAPCTARLCRPSPAGGPRAVRRPAAPPALLADGGCVPIVRRRTLIRLKHTPSPLGTCVITNKPKDTHSLRWSYSMQ